MRHNPNLIEFNLNDFVLVKLNENGKRIHKNKFDQLRNIVAPYYKEGEKTGLGEYKEPEEDKDGYSKWILWELMQEFGPYITMGFDPPFDTTIKLIIDE